jgi:hypothetical protein
VTLVRLLDVGRHLLLLLCDTPTDDRLYKRRGP